MRSFSEILKRKEQRKQKLEESLDSIVRQLAELGALRIILFGSLADGEVDVYSDLDLLVIMPESKSGREWMKIIYSSLDRGVASDIIAYNREEFERDLPVKSFLREVVRTGKVVYEQTT